MTTYDFLDVSVTISHPSVGTFSMVGEGVGSISVSMTTDRTAHDPAADGSIMVSKIRARNGSVSISIQQTSYINRWLLKWYNYVEAANASVWADAKIIIRAPQMGELTTCKGVSPQKIPDNTYQAQGQNITWSLMAADIQKDAI